MTALKIHSGEEIIRSDMSHGVGNGHSSNPVVQFLVYK